MEKTIFEFTWGEVAEEIVKELNNLSTKIGASYKDISEVLNIDAAYVHKILHRKKDLTLKTFIRICLALIELNKRNNEPIPTSDIYPSSILKRIGL